MSGRGILTHNLAMRSLLSVSILSVGLLAAVPSFADQNDPRLDNLFDVLRFSEEPLEIRATENLIWATWMHHDNAEYDRLMRVGSAALSAGQFDQAVGIFSSLIEKAPDYAEAWNKRATVYFLIGDLALSVEDVGRTLELEPRHFGALSGLGQIELLRGNGDAALKAFEGALEVHPQLPGIEGLIRELEETVHGREL